MRKQLKMLEGRRLRFSARFERFGWKSGYMGPERTVLLTDVRFVPSGGMATDHVWFTCGKTFDRLDLHPGDRIMFDARVGQYEKGYRGWRAERTGEAWSAVDYRLERPTKAVKLSEAEPGAMSEDDVGGRRETVLVAE